MRVGLDVTALLGPRTGIGVFTAELVAGLPGRHGIEPVAFATSWRGRDGLAGAVPDGWVVAGRPMPARPLRALWRRGDRPRLQRWTGPLDLVHGPNYVVPPAGGTPSVASVHDLTFLRFPQLSTRDTLEYPDLLRRAVRRGAWIHVDATAIGEEVVEAFGVPAERVVRVPLAPSPIPPAPDGEGHRLAGSDRYVLALGTVEPRKDLPLLVRAFDALADGDDDLRLVIAGPDGWGAEALGDALAAARHHHRVVRLGWVDAGQRAALLRGATVLAYPSVYEGFGLPPLEAMSVGTPVVATAVGALPETCGDAAVLVAPGDRDALVEGLSRVLTDEDLAADLRRRGTAHASQFSWDRTVDELVALYRRLAG